MDTRKPRNSEAGAALPFALVVTLALVVVVTDMGLRAQVSFDRAHRVLRLAESRSLLRKVVSGLAALNETQIFALAESEREFEVDRYRIRLRMRPAESKINIQRLDDLTAGGPIGELFSALLKRERFEQRAYASALDWIDADDDPRSLGAEGLDYVGEDVSPRNAPVETVDELSFIRGFRDASAFERIRPLLTTFGSGKIYVPAAPDKILDIFEDVYGVRARNALEDMRRNPARGLQISSGTMSPDAIRSLESLVTNVPSAWEIDIVLTGYNFHVKSEYVLTIGGESAPNRMIRIG